MKNNVALNRKSKESALKSDKKNKYPQIPSVENIDEEQVNTCQH